MNILEEIAINDDKPGVLVVKNNDNIRILAVALQRGQELSKHTTNLPTLLTVIKGQVTFHINDQHHVLDLYDTYEIPVNVVHEVDGLSDINVFTLTQEKAR